MEAKLFVHKPEQHVIADELLALNPGILQKHAEKEKCITLDEQLGKSRNNKNAVSICRTFVGFMVGTDAKSIFSSDAERLSLATSYNEEHRALRFPNLVVEQIRTHSDFFVRLLVEAKRESQRRQG